MRVRFPSLIITVGRTLTDGYVLADDSLQGTPNEWATAAVRAHHRYKADRIVAEANNGGEMVKLTIAAVDPSVSVVLVHALPGQQRHVQSNPERAMNGCGSVLPEHVIPDTNREMYRRKEEKADN